MISSYASRRGSSPPRCSKPASSGCEATVGTASWSWPTARSTWSSRALTSARSRAPSLGIAGARADSFPDGKLCRHHGDHRAAHFDSARQLRIRGIGQLAVNETRPAHLRALFAHDRDLGGPRDHAVAHGKRAERPAKRLVREDIDPAYPVRASALWHDYDTGYRRRRWKRESVLSAARSSSADAPARRSARMGSASSSR